MIFIFHIFENCLNEISTLHFLQIRFIFVKNVGKNQKFVQTTLQLAEMVLSKPVSEYEYLSSSVRIDCDTKCTFVIWSFSNRRIARIADHCFTFASDFYRNSDSNLYFIPTRMSNPVDKFKNSRITMNTSTLYSLFHKRIGSQENLILTTKFDACEAKTQQFLLVADQSNEEESGNAIIFELQDYLRVSIEHDERESTDKFELPRKYIYFARDFMINLVLESCTRD